MATYPFVRLDEARRRLLADGIVPIDFGKGDPNEPTDPIIRQALIDALPVRAPYPLAEGLPELREAAAGWVGRRFGVNLDPDTEIVPTYGSKEAIFSFAEVLDVAGRTVAYGEPAYPVYERGAVLAGARVRTSASWTTTSHSSGSTTRTTRRERRRRASSTTSSRKPQSVTTS
jgi:aspartate/methionine/tyrosine aminotransferase